MSYIDDYKARVGNGSIANTIADNAKEIIKNTISYSPSYQLVDIKNKDGVITSDVEVRILSGNESNKKRILFKPDTSYNKGDIVTFDLTDWLIMDFQAHNNIFPKAEIQLCNSTIKWNDDVNTYEHPCVVESKAETIDENRDIDLPDGQINVFTQYNSETKKILLDLRFVFGSNIFKVQGIDDITNIFNDIGYLKLNLTRTTEREGKDDIANRLADNSGVYNSGSSGGDIKW